jgi:hypothetical protein
VTVAASENRDFYPRLEPAKHHDLAGVLHTISSHGEADAARLFVCGRSVEQMRRNVALRPSGMSPTLMNRMVSVPSVAGMLPGGNPCALARQATSSVLLCSQRGLSELSPVDIQGGVGGMDDAVAKRLIGVGTTVGARHG